MKTLLILTCAALSATALKAAQEPPPKKSKSGVKSAPAQAETKVAHPNPKIHSENRSSAIQSQKMPQRSVDHHEQPVQPKGGESVQGSNPHGKQVGIPNGSVPAQKT